MKKNAGWVLLYYNDKEYYVYDNQLKPVKF